FLPLIFLYPLLPPLFPYTTLFRSPPRRSRLPEPPRPPGGTGRATRRCCTGALSARRSGLRRAPSGAGRAPGGRRGDRAERQEARSEEHTSELQSRFELVCRLLPEK